MSVYLDYASTAPLCKESADAILPYMSADADPRYFANPNSLHTAGREAFKSLEEARKVIQRSIGASRPDEIVFTGSATEADNAAILGIAGAAAEERRIDSPEIIISAIEHPAVIEPANSLKRAGFSVKILEVDRDGFVEVSKLGELLTNNTVLVSIVTANSEIGSIQAIEQLSEATHKAGALFHTDAVQALGKMKVDVGEWGVDAATFSGHKIGAPKGIGALFLRSRVPFDAQMLGGGQELGKRSGTQNVAGTVAFAAACDACVKAQEDESNRLIELRDKLYNDLASFSEIQPTVEVESGSLDYLPNMVNVMFLGLESQTLVMQFDRLGFEVSGGSACSSGSLKPSSVLTALGISADEAQGELRISMGRRTTRADVNAFLEAVPEVLAFGR